MKQCIILENNNCCPHDEISGKICSECRIIDTGKHCRKCSMFNTGIELNHSDSSCFNCGSKIF